ncbi:hypothetical protein vseg_018496 [Gypsophila vaccaria]
MEDNNCSHRVFLGGKCMTCQKPIDNCKEVTIVPFNYFYGGIDMSLSLSAIDEYREHDLRAILTREKLHLILDLDHTLLHSKRVQNLTVEDMQLVVSNPKELYKVEDGSMLVKLRPGVSDFIAKVRGMFELSIYTMGSRNYAHRMANLLAKGSGLEGQSMFGVIISKEDCTKVGQKGLDIFLSYERVVLIVDDKKNIWETSCRANVVKIEPYLFFQDEKVEEKVSNKVIGPEEEVMDDGLKRVLDTLSSVHSMFYDDNSENCVYMKRDVRRVLKMVSDNEKKKMLTKDETMTLDKDNDVVTGALANMPNVTVPPHGEISFS